MQDLQTVKEFMHQVNKNATQHHTTNMQEVDSVEGRRERIDNLVGVNFKTDRPGTYDEFKQVMCKIHQCEFERRYLRSLYRQYKAKFKALNK